MEQQQTLGGKPLSTGSYAEEQQEAKLAELEAEAKANSSSAASGEYHKCVHVEIAKEKLKKILPTIIGTKED
jgi:hypothetical protein